MPAKPPKPFTLVGTYSNTYARPEEARCVITNAGLPHICTEGEVMTLRVAVSSMLQDLRKDRGESLGEIGQMYITNLERLERLLCVREA